MSDADADVGGMRMSRDLELARPVELVVEVCVCVLPRTSFFGTAAAAAAYST
jgi:hypothetical protein